MDTHETKIYIALLIVAANVGLFLVFFITTIFRHQRRNQKLYKEKIHAEITTLEKERSRIASDLHDDLGPMLATVKMRINNFELLDKNDKDELSKINNYIDGIFQQVQRISNDLLPQVLIRKGLIVALEEHIREFNSKGKMKIRLAIEPDLSIDAAIGIHLYRIILESIHNAEKHADASIMDIQIQRKHQQITLLMKDNGKGFDFKKEQTDGKGHGLKNIASRVETMNGTIYLHSTKQGTFYSIEIPKITKI